MFDSGGSYHMMGHLTMMQGTQRIQPTCILLPSSIHTFTKQAMNRDAKGKAKME